MKAKLRKDKDHYRLFVEDKQIGSTGTRVSSKEMYQLSFENCDEIFGGFDVNKLAEECSIDWEGELMESIVGAYKEGFNKAMELKKDKMFTLEDVKKSIEMAREENGLSDNTMSYDYSEDEIIQSIQQPSEIEVIIEMKLNMNGKNAIERSMYIPKLDENGCLILTKK